MSWANKFTDFCFRAVGDRAALSGEKPEAPADTFASLGTFFILTSFKTGQYLYLFDFWCCFVNFFYVPVSEH